MAKVEKEKGKEEKGSGHYSSHFPFFINTLYYSNIQILADISPETASFSLFLPAQKQIE